MTLRIRCLSCGEPSEASRSNFIHGKVCISCGCIIELHDETVVCYKMLSDEERGRQPSTGLDYSEEVAQVIIYSAGPQAEVAKSLLLHRIVDVLAGS